LRKPHERLEHKFDHASIAGWRTARAAASRQRVGEARMMPLLRSVLFSLYLLCYTVPYAIFSALTFPLKREIRYTLIATYWARGVMWGARTICGIRYRIEGWENIPHHGVIFLPKHQSRWETILLPSLIPLLCFVYKRELHWIPFFGWGIALCGMIPIDRASGKESLMQVVEEGGKRLREGWNVVLFPEGTRVLPGHKRRYKIGGAHLAVSTGTHVAPIAHNAGDFWPRDRFIKHPGEITVIFGPLIAPDGMTPDQLNERVENWIETEMRRRFPHQYRGIA
jgi:1-acyl-sn-glycerol-3-phosphate acyltransferase